MNPCNTVAVATGVKLSSTSIRIRLPAMPMMLKSLQ
jgi:hypothetical protein